MRNQQPFLYDKKKVKEDLFSEDMSEETRSCQRCQKPSELQCGGCRLVWYCSKKHQKLEWKNHKPECIPYEIKNTQSELGRHLVATRDIKQGDLIFSSYPSVIGPRLEFAGPFCLGCNKSLSVSNGACLCGYQMCSQACKASINHSNECKILQKIAQLQNRYELISILRFALLKSTKKSLFQNLSLLEDHLTELKLSNERWPHINDSIIQRLEPIIRDLGYDSISEIESLVGIWITNSFQLNQNQSDSIKSLEKGQNVSLQGLYDVPSLMNHDCVGNTRLTIEGGSNRLNCYASVRVRRGDSIRFNYIRSMDDLESRQEILKMNKYFTCSCRRCRSGDELGTFSSSLLCPACKSAPTIRTDKTGKYKCVGCSNVLSEKEVLRIFGIINATKSRIHRGCPSWNEGTKLIRELEGVLWKNHVLLLEIKMIVVNSLDMDPRSMPLREEKEINEKILDWASTILSILDVIDPGYSLARGLVLYRLQAAQIFLENYKFENIEVTRETEIAHLLTLKESRSKLYESWKCMSFETKDTIFGQKARDIAEELKDLGNHINMVEEIINIV